MAYTLSNKCAKNLCKRTVLLKLIVKNVVTCFNFEHSVVVTAYLCVAVSCVEFYRATRMYSADYAVARCLSVCLPVRLSHAGIESKRFHISSKSIHHRVAPPF